MVLVEVVEQPQQDKLHQEIVVMVVMVLQLQ